MGGHHTGSCEGGAAGGGRFGIPPARARRISPFRRPLSWLALALVRLYQKTLSRLWPNVCIYYPSCSHYMIHAVINRGLIVGGFMGLWRILRCHPFARGGYDPPPGYEDALRRETETALRDAEA